MSNNMYVTLILKRHLNKEASLVLYIHKTLIPVSKETLLSFSTRSFFDLQSANNKTCFVNHKWRIIPEPDFFFLGILAIV